MFHKDFYFLKISRELALRRKYYVQGMNACGRGILFKLTFEEWLQIWLESGHLRERGTGGDKYVMARNGDQGPYKVGNVRIVTCSQNSKETWENKPEIMRESLKKANAKSASARRKSNAKC